MRTTNTSSVTHHFPLYQSVRLRATVWMINQTAEVTLVAPRVHRVLQLLGGSGRCLTPQPKYWDHKKTNCPLVFWKRHYSHASGHHLRCCEGESASYLLLSCSDPLYGMRDIAMQWQAAFRVKLLITRNKTFFSLRCWCGHIIQSDLIFFLFFSPIFSFFSKVLPKHLIVYFHGNGCCSWLGLACFGERAPLGQIRSIFSLWRCHLILPAQLTLRQL